MWKERDSVGGSGFCNIPQAEKGSFRVENLDPRVGPVANVDGVGGIGGDSVREPELAFVFAGAAPLIEETALSVKMRNAGVLVPVRHKHRSVGQECHVRRHVEVTGAGAGGAGFP